MPPKGPTSAVSSQALQSGALPTQTRMSAGAIGEAGSRDALARLNAAMGELKAIAVQPYLQRAVTALQKEDHQAGCEWALKALEHDERNGFGWYLLAIARERAGDFASSVTCYESALALIPDHAEVANDLGRLALRMGMAAQAEKLFRHFLARHPNHHEGANNLACAIRVQGRLEDAVDILKPALMAAPEQPILWNTMGTVVAEQGDFTTAVVFFNEAMRLKPDLAKAVYNLGHSKLSLGDSEGALADVDASLAMMDVADERQMVRLLRAYILLTLGRTREGWDEYEARLDPQFADVLLFHVTRPRWVPGDDLAAKRLLVIGEQGLGDEVLLANTLPDVIDDLGPDGHLTIAVEPRLVPLFQRSFPSATVGAHQTGSLGGRAIRLVPFVEDQASLDSWIPVGSLLRHYRPDVDAFPKRERFLTPNPGRVAHWRKVLQSAPAGPKVGLLWKSAVNANARHRFYSPFEQWAPVLAQEDVCFVNLQYGDCAAELEFVRRELGVEIWQPPGIDLKQDLDDVAALCSAMDLVIGSSNATMNLAAACGAPSWLITVPGAWPRLGTDRYPWYPQMRVFATKAYGEWDGVMSEVAEALAAFAASPER
jgi:Tfp pilus assembly protein PilF